MKTKFNPNQEAILTYTPDFQSQPFTVTGLGESLLPVVAAVESLQPVQTMKDTAPVPKPIQTGPENVYVDFSALPTRIVARKKLQARMYDLLHRTTMYDALVERIEEDRDISFARDLGILGVTRCAKHERAVSKLRGIL